MAGFRGDPEDGFRFVRIPFAVTGHPGKEGDLFPGTGREPEAPVGIRDPALAVPSLPA